MKKGFASMTIVYSFLLVFLLTLVTLLAIYTDKSRYVDSIVSEGKDEIWNSITNMPDLKINSLKINGVEVQTMPSDYIHMLATSSCTNGAVLSWDLLTKKLSVSNITKRTSCSLNFITLSYLANASIGSYVAYTGTNGCPTTAVTGTGAAQSAQACTGQNANQTSTTGPTYGYCSSSTYQFNSYGWRLAYKLDGDSDGKLEPYLISAGSPQCITAVDYNSASTISSYNSNSLKYCNPDYAYGGACSSSVAWAAKDSDFQLMTNQILGATRTLAQCINLSTTETKTACGYYSDLFSNAGFYKYAAAYNSSSVYYWNPLSSGYLYWNDRANSMGVRPVLRLSSNVYIIGGSGTMEDPYQIQYY